jgi:hypothetical protein
MKVARLSAPHTGRLYPQEMLLALISVRGWVDPRAIVWLEGLSMKKSSDTIGNQTCGFLVCNAVPQSLHHRVPHYSNTNSNSRWWENFKEVARENKGGWWSLFFYSNDNILQQRVPQKGRWLEFFMKGWFFFQTVHGHILNNWCKH